MDHGAGVVPALYEGPLRDRDGLLVGRVDDVLYDAETNRAAWVVVRLGGDADGARRALAPARGLRFVAGGGGCALACTAADVHACPAGLDVATAAQHYGVRRFLRGDAAAFTTTGRTVVSDGTAHASYALAG
ncbi:PRC-barrel domain-containing protein [Conexibacter woesei]|uniref:PRC-barrel domain-containing protein n=1 Tax=Conexibacter woesei TaxID=191495 RepID=UPI0012DE4CCA|nr:PRC-barrel domain-containing protein [Conexibacter woesei]